MSAFKRSNVEELRLNYRVVSVVVFHAVCSSTSIRCVNHGQGFLFNFDSSNFTVQIIAGDCPTSMIAQNFVINYHYNNVIFLTSSSGAFLSSRVIANSVMTLRARNDYRDRVINLEARRYSKVMRSNFYTVNV